MARKRDYKAEYARRNALARARGFSGYAEQRRKIEKGLTPAIQASRIRKESTRAAQRKLWRSRGPKDKTFAEYVSEITPESRAHTWSVINAWVDIGEYHPERAKELGISKREYTRAYMAAFVDGERPYMKDDNRHEGSEALYHWLVDINHYFEANEYEVRYGKRFAKTDSDDDWDYSDANNPAI